MIYARGGEYDGEWKKGKRDGHGVMKYSDNEVYEVKRRITPHAHTCHLFLKF